MSDAQNCGKMQILELSERPFRHFVRVRRVWVIWWDVMSDVRCARVKCDVRCIVSILGDASCQWRDEMWWSCEMSVVRCDVTCEMWVMCVRCDMWVMWDVSDVERHVMRDVSDVLRCDARCEWCDGVSCEMWVMWWDVVSSVRCEWCQRCEMWVMCDVRFEWCGAMWCECFGEMSWVMRDVRDVGRCDVRCEWCGEMWCEMWVVWWGVMWDVSDVVRCGEWREMSVMWDVSDVWCEMWVMWWVVMWDAVVLKLRNSEVSQPDFFWHEKFPHA